MIVIWHSDYINLAMISAISAKVFVTGDSLCWSWKEVSESPHETILGFSEQKKLFYQNER
jgi:hypothetical protein